MLILSLQKSRQRSVRQKSLVQNCSELCSLFPLKLLCHRVRWDAKPVSLKFPTLLKHMLNIWSSQPALRYKCKRNETYIHTKAVIHVHSSYSPSSNWKQDTSPLTSEWVSRLWCTCTLDLCSAQGGNGPEVMAQWVRVLAAQLWGWSSSAGTHILQLTAGLQ